MPESYSSAPGESAQEHISPGVVTVAMAMRSHHSLTKTFHKGGVTPYDRIKYFAFYEYEIFSLDDLASIVRKSMDKPRVCLLRCRVKDKNYNMQRLFNGDDATLIEQAQNWFALDIDGYAESSGDVETDCKKVLVGLGWKDTECIGLASSSYGIKSGIHLRMFFWADRKVDCATLKKFMTNNKVCADLAMFHPIQPIYVATPIFNDGLKDPVEKRMVLLAGVNRTVPIGYEFQASERKPEIRRTKKEAVVFHNSACKKIGEAEQGSRHVILREQSIMIGKLIAQGLIDGDDAIMDIEFACATWGGNRDRKRDRETMLYGIELGKRSIDNDGETL